MKDLFIISNAFLNADPANAPKSNYKRSFQNRGSITITVLCAIFFLLLIASLPAAQSSSKYSKKTSRSQLPCKRQTSDWSKCTKACGMGISTRIAVKGKCKLRRESRLCMVRPCEEVFVGTKSSGKHRCLRHQRKTKPRHLTYIDGKSEKKYKMRFCGGCSDVSKCCTPTKTKTKKVRFRRRDGTRFSKRMMFVRKCRCHGNCSSMENSMVFTFPLYHDMHREEGKEALQATLDQPVNLE